MMGKTIKEESNNIKDNLIQNFDDVNNNFELSTEVEEPQEIVLGKQPKQTKENKRLNKMETDKRELINCLRNEVIIAKYIAKPFALSENPKHVFAGNMSENATKTFTVPLNSVGGFVNPLTSDEQAYLEYVMGLEPNDLSVYLKVNNYWDNFRVSLKKNDNYFRLDNPEDYIRYKVLLANTEFIAGSISIYEASPKATYQYLLISEKEQINTSNNKMSVNMNAYRLLGKIEKDVDILKFVVEVLSGKPVSTNSSLEFLQANAHDLLLLNPKLFVQIVDDKYLPIKVLIMKGVEKGVIRKRLDYYYLQNDNSPLSVGGAEPTLDSAAKYLSEPRNQELKFKLEAQIK